LEATLFRRKDVWNHVLSQFIDKLAHRDFAATHYYQEVVFAGRIFNGAAAHFPDGTPALACSPHYCGEVLKAFSPVVL
jgi:hypothetical protein